MMNYEEVERKIEFIINQQAQFAVDLDLLREAQSTTAHTVSEMGHIVTRLAYVTNEGFKHLTAKIDTLIDSQIRHEGALAAQQKRTDERFEALTESQERTEELLQKFLRGLNDRRNGK